MFSCYIITDNAATWLDKDGRQEVVKNNIKLVIDLKKNYTIALHKTFLISLFHIEFIKLIVQNVVWSS